MCSQQAGRCEWVRNEYMLHNHYTAPYNFRVAFADRRRIEAALELKDSILNPFPLTSAAAFRLRGGTTS